VMVVLGIMSPSPHGGIRPTSRPSVCCSPKTKLCYSAPSVPIAPGARLVSRRQAGEILNVSYSGVEALERAGKLRAVRLFGAKRRGRVVHCRLDDVLALTEPEGCDR
jgi:hypothetical protein